MTLLIIHCPPKPLSDISDLSVSYNAQLDQFNWCLYQTDAITEKFQESGTGTIESMPYADEVIALIRTIDVRLLKTKVPLIKSNTLQQILPSLIEDQVLGGVENALIYVLPPAAGQPGSHRVLAVIEKSWFYWLSQQLENIVAPRIRLIPDCFILPGPIDGQPGSLAVKNSERSHIYTQHISEQLGISWIEDKDHGQLPSSLLGINTITWSWSWMAPNTFSFSRRTDFASSNLNLLLAAPSIGKLRVKDRLKRFMAFTDLNAETPEHHFLWSDGILWNKSIRSLSYALCSMLIGGVTYSSWLAIDNWRWARNIDISARHFLSSDSISLLTKNKSGHTITSVFVEQLTQEARKKGFPTDADFAPMAEKLQQLKVALNKDLVEKIEYDGIHLDFQFKPDSHPTSASDIINTAGLLGSRVIDLGNNRYRLQPYSGLGADARNISP